MESKVSWQKQLAYDIQQKWGQSDLYRETPIRYLGYTNEVGEAFRAWVPVSLVRLSYVIASGYVVADALDKSHKAYNKEWQSAAERRKHVALTMADTLTWQAFASVIVPGITINRLCAFSAFMLRRFSRMSNPGAKLATTAIGLAAIPFIVKPIDAMVEVGMDSTLRKYYSTKDVQEPIIADTKNLVANHKHEN
ncbi:mitochondrial 18 KDa protein (MTP18) domain-containing protein [Ditylenchus destructor]|nr:mitochondrial 18 KDa protein (MTP18) domain-containing protein [Ditylenchus destructor]